MTLLMLLEMVASAFGDRVAVGTASRGLTYQELHDRAGAGAEVIRRHGAQHLAYVGSSGAGFLVIAEACRGPDDDDLGVRWRSRGGGRGAAPWMIVPSCGW